MENFYSNIFDDYSQSFSFLLQEQEYNPSNAYYLSQMCSLAYVQKKSLIQKWGLNYKLIKQGEAKCLVLWNETLCVLAFPGTDCFEDIYIDLKIIGIDLGEGKYVHKGFYESSQSLIPYLEETFKEISLENKKVWVTGHSLGGAQAVLIAYFMKELKDIVGIYTFAQPKIGNSEFCNCIKKHLKKYYRIVNHLDPIPLLPLNSGILSLNNHFKYEHIKGEYILYSHSGEMTWLHSESVIRQFRLSSLLNLKSKKNIEKFLLFKLAHKINHGIEIYIKKASENIK